MRCDLVLDLCTRTSALTGCGFHFLFRVSCQSQTQRWIIRVGRTGSLPLLHDQCFAGTVPVEAGIIIYVYITLTLLHFTIIILFPYDQSSTALLGSNTVLAVDNRPKRMQLEISMWCSSL